MNEKDLAKALGLPDQDACPHPRAMVMHVLPRAGAGGTVCNRCQKAWPDAADGTWTGPLKGDYQGAKV